MVIFRENTEDIYSGIEFANGTQENKKFKQLFKDAFPKLAPQQLFNSRQSYLQSEVVQNFCWIACQNPLSTTLRYDASFMKAAPFDGMLSSPHHLFRRIGINHSRSRPVATCEDFNLTDRPGRPIGSYRDLGIVPSDPPQSTHQSLRLFYFLLCDVCLPLCVFVTRFMPFTPVTFHRLFSISEA